MADGVSPRTTVRTTSKGGRHKRRSSVGGRTLSEAWQKWFFRAEAIVRRAWSYVIVPGGSGFLLGRAVVFDQLHPFGPAYVVALAASGQRGRALIAAVGVLWGALHHPAGPDDLAAVLIVVWIISTVGSGMLSAPPWASAFGAMLGAMTLRVVTAAFGQEEVLYSALASGIDLAAAIALLPVAMRMFGVRDTGTADLSRPSLPSDSSFVASALLLTASMLLGLYGLYWREYAFFGPVARVLLLLASVTGGSGAGTMAGTSLALLTMLGTGTVAWESTVYAASGLISGFGGFYGRLGAVVGLLAAHMLLSPYATDGYELAAALLYSVAASVIVALLPGASVKQWKSRTERFLMGRTVRRHTRAAVLVFRRRLEQFATVFDQAASAFTTEEAAGVDGDRLSTDQTGRSGRTQSDGQVTSHMTPLASQTGSATHSQERAWFDDFAQNVFETVCATCSHRSVCWETYGYQTYQDLLTFVAHAGARAHEGRRLFLDAGDLPRGLRQRCIRAHHFAPEVGDMLNVMQERGQGPQRVLRTEPPIRRQLSGIADIIAGVAKELNRLEKSSDALMSRRPGQPRFQLQTDYVQVAGDASSVSGDSFERVVLPDGRVAIIVCDGMGSGPRAAVESRAVAAMLRRFLEAGFDLRFCVQTINSVMLLRAKEESFVTVDVCVIDLHDGKAHLIKTGAAPTFIHRGPDIEVVRADSLPVGILPRVEPFEMTKQLRLGDVLVMMSDGGLDLAPSTVDKVEAVRRKLKRMQRPRPRQVVDELFVPIHKGLRQQLPDDVTIVAAQLVPSVIASA